MNKQRKAELEESLSSALEPPRQRQIKRLDSILADYIDPRDLPSPARERTTDSETAKESDATKVQHTTLAQHTTPEPDTTLVQHATLASSTTLAQKTRVVRRSTLAQSQGAPWHDTRVEQPTTLAQHATVVPHTIVEIEYTKTPNDIWDEVMPTLDPYDQTVLWQLYRLSRGYHRDTCTIGFPRLATRCNISTKQAQISVSRLEKRGFIARLGSDFGNRNVAERGNIYKVFLPEGREAPRARVARDTRVEPHTTVVPDTSMKLNTQKENTQTQIGAGVSSRFSLEECQRYANHLKATGQGITNPGGYATKVFRSGEADALIESFLNPKALLDLSQCPDCHGSNFIYIDQSNPDKGVKPCRHEQLK